MNAARAAAEIYEDEEEGKWAGHVVDAEGEEIAVLTKAYDSAEEARDALEAVMEAIIEGVSVG